MRISETGKIIRVFLTIEASKPSSRKQDHMPTHYEKIAKRIFESNAAKSFDPWAFMCMLIQALPTCNPSSQSSASAQLGLFPSVEPLKLYTDILALCDIKRKKRQLELYNFFNTVNQYDGPISAESDILKIINAFLSYYPEYQPLLENNEIKNQIKIDTDWVNQYGDIKQIQALTIPYCLWSMHEHDHAPQKEQPSKEELKATYDKIFSLFDKKRMIWETEYEYAKFLNSSLALLTSVYKQLNQLSTQVAVVHEKDKEESKENQHQHDYALELANQFCKTCLREIEAQDFWRIASRNYSWSNAWSETSNFVAALSPSHRDVFLTQVFDHVKLHFYSVKSLIPIFKNLSAALSAEERQRILENLAYQYKDYESISLLTVLLLPDKVSQESHLLAENTNQTSDSSSSSSRTVLPLVPDDADERKMDSEDDKVFQLTKFKNKIVNDVIQDESLRLPNVYKYPHYLYLFHRVEKSQQILLIDAAFDKLKAISYADEDNQFVIEICKKLHESPALRSEFFLMKETLFQKLDILLQEFPQDTLLNHIRRTANHYIQALLFLTQKEMSDKDRIRFNDFYIAFFDKYEFSNEEISVFTSHFSQSTPAQRRQLMTLHLEYPAWISDTYYDLLVAMACSISAEESEVISLSLFQTLTTPSNNNKLVAGSALIKILQNHYKGDALVSFIKALDVNHQLSDHYRDVFPAQSSSASASSSSSSVVDNAKSPYLPIIDFLVSTTANKATIGDISRSPHGFAFIFKMADPTRRQVILRHCIEEGCTSNNYSSISLQIGSEECLEILYSLVDSMSDNERIMVIRETLLVWKNTTNHEKRLQLVANVVIHAVEHLQENKSSKELEEILNEDILPKVLTNIVLGYFKSKGK